MLKFSLSIDYIIFYNFSIVFFPFYLSFIQAYIFPQSTAVSFAAVMPPVHSGGATPRHARANAMAEKPPPLLPPWQSKGVIIQLLSIGLYLIAVADATNGLPMPCHGQRTGAATAYKLTSLNYSTSVLTFLSTKLQFCKTASSSC